MCIRDSLRLLDVLVTQHPKWTARRTRRALFGQSLVDFSGPSWSSVKIHKSNDPEPTQVNRRKAKVSRMTREFSQTVPAEDAQPCLDVENCHCLVPGMSQYSNSQTFSEVGTTEFKGGMSLSTSAADQTELPQSLDWAQESTNNSGDFLPATK